MTNTKPVFHGSDIEKISEYYHIDQNSITNFAGNVNPLGLSPSVKEAVAAHVDLFSSYPDRDYKSLRNTIAEYCDVPADFILPGNGSSELISLLIETRAPKRTLILGPTYSEYSRELSFSGSTQEYYHLQESMDFEPDIPDLCRKLEQGYDFLILCNPNNPTGRLLPLPLLEWILQGCAAWGARVFLDECFLDLTEDGISARSLLAAHPALLILKAFTKSYGMAGIRLGYCLCTDNALLHDMAAASPPWNVSSPAQSAGVAALAERDFLQRTLSLVRTERRWLTDNLTALGFWVCPSHANYLLFRGPLGLRERLLQQGIAIRGCGNYNGLDDGWYRIAVRPHGENEALITAIRQFCKEKSLWQ